MKKSVLFILMTLAVWLFAGCASLPEPKSSDSNMLYGFARYKGLYVFGGTSKSVSSEKVNNIRIIVKNLDDGMTYSTKTNADGEFAIEGVTAGNYVVKYLGTEYRYDGKKWQIRYNVPTSEEGARFTVSNGVTNMGRIIVNLDTDSGEDYVSWANDFEGVAQKFKQLHSESKWNDYTWVNSKN
ncbi:MAG: carboxypeptidase regulatory-like domain-containing protein [Treponema sp.]|jgi:hypothetical protein|nr:carboxypeptidase regulatory-like domain-containing protein [Treponema sp.]